MKKNCSSKQCCDNRYSAQTGGLIGIAFVAIHVVYHAMINHVPEAVYSHVLGEMVAGALGGAALFAGGSALCNWIKQPL